MRGSIGARGGTASARIPLRPSLLAMEYKKAPEPLKRTDIPPSAGAGRTRAARKVKHSDAVVLEVRRLREQCGLASYSRIAEELQKKGVEITDRDVIRYASYATRGALVPDEGATSYL